MSNTKTSNRKYHSVSSGEGKAVILAPNGRQVAVSHSPRTTRRVMAALNGGSLPDYEKLGARKHRAPTGKVMVGHPILSANGRVIASCTSRYAQLRITESLNIRARRYGMSA